ncbi:MAG: hypothetical protein GYB65_14735 [Chloroflexi bacterium]|nr:hypothetical protein [Chloroflexota bacterium]
MVKVVVNAGACGEHVVIYVTRLDTKRVRVMLETGCKQVDAMNPGLDNLLCLGKGHDVFVPVDRSAVYRAAVDHNLHPACPVPAAILRAIEAELGIAVARDVTIEFQVE